MTEQTGVLFCLFDTTIGRCAIAWTVRGIVGVLLPERHDGAMRARLLRRHRGACESAPPQDVERAIASIVALLGGEPRDLSDVVLDFAGVPDFNRRVYAVARTIKPGATLTYGAIAARLGEPDARGVGEALGHNPSRSSCPVTASWRQAARPAASRRLAAPSPSAACSPSKAPWPTLRRCLIATAGWISR
jgi:methylated-DNA-[protein]-cysteine S-methyltransferase